MVKVIFMANKSEAEVNPKGENKSYLCYLWFFPLESIVSFPSSVPLPWFNSDILLGLCSHLLTGPSLLQALLHTSRRVVFLNSTPTLSLSVCPHLMWDCPEWLAVYNWTPVSCWVSFPASLPRARFSFFSVSEVVRHFYSTSHCVVV